MKFYFSLLILFTMSIFAYSQTTNTGAPGGVISAIPTPIPATATPTVNMAAAPKIFSASPNFDFHDVDEGPDIHHEFKIRNKGKSALKITNVGTSCGCTAAVLKKQGSKDEAATLPVEIPAGGRGTILATYHTANRPGHATKVITISCNDPVNPNFQLKLDMTVVRDVDVQPDRVYLYNVKFKEAHDTSIKILGKPGAPLTILSAESANKVVTVTSLAPVTENAPAPAPVPGQPVPKEQKRYGATLMVSLPATQPIGTVADEIVVKTSSPKKPEIRIQVMGKVVGRVQYQPEFFSFSPHQDSPVTIQLTVDPPKGFQIRDVRSVKHLARPSVKKTRGPNGDQFSVIASVVKNLPKDSDGKDQIIVETNDVEQRSVTIEVQAQK